MLWIVLSCIWWIVIYCCLFWNKHQFTVVAEIFCLKTQSLEIIVEMMGADPSANTYNCLGCFCLSRLKSHRHRWKSIENCNNQLTSVKIHQHSFKYIEFNRIQFKPITVWQQKDLAKSITINETKVEIQDYQSESTGIISNLVMLIRIYWNLWQSMNIDSNQFRSIPIATQTIGICLHHWKLTNIFWNHLTLVKSINICWNL